MVHSPSRAGPPATPAPVPSSEVSSMPGRARASARSHSPSPATPLLDLARLAGYDSSNLAAGESAGLAEIRRVLAEHEESQKQRDAALASLVSLLLTSAPLPDDASLRQSILGANSLADILLAVRQDVAPLPDTAGEVADLRTKLAKSERVAAARLKRMESAIAESANTQHRLDTATHETAKWRAASLRTTELVESFNKTILQLKAQAKADLQLESERTQAAERTIQGLNAELAARERTIDQLGRQLVEANAAQTVLRGVATKYFRDAQEAAVLACSGGDYALANAKRTISRQAEVILSQKAVIRTQRPLSAVAALVGVDVPGLDPRDLHLNARLCRILAERFPESIELASSTSPSEISLRIRPVSSSSQAPITSASEVQPNPASATPSSSASEVSSSSASEASGVPLGRSRSKHSHRQSSRQSRRSVSQLRNAPLRDLTSSERLRRYANPASPTAAGSRRSRSKSVPRGLYERPVPGEEGFDPATTLLSAEVIDEYSPSLLIPGRKRLRAPASSLLGPGSSGYRPQRPSLSPSQSPDPPTATNSGNLPSESPSTADSDMARSSVVLASLSQAQVTALDSSSPSSSSASISTQLLDSSSDAFSPSRSPSSSSGIAAGSRSVPARSTSSVSSTSLSSSAIVVYSPPSVVPALGSSCPATSSRRRPSRAAARNATCITHAVLEELDAADDDVLGTAATSSTPSSEVLPPGPDAGGAAESDDDYPSSTSTMDLSDQRTPPRGKLQSYADARRVVPSAVKRGCAPVAPPKSSRKKRAAPEVPRRATKKAKSSVRSPAPVSKPTAPRKVSKGRPQKSGPRSSEKINSSSVSRRPTSPRQARSAKPTSTSPSTSALSASTSVVELPPTLALPLAKLRARAAQAIAREARETPAMRQTRDVVFFHYGSARCWAKITACRSPVKMEDIDGKPQVVSTPVSLDGLRRMMKVFDSSHPCQHVLAKFPETPMFISENAIDLARHRLHMKKRFLWRFGSGTTGW
uniref:Uncharacterized protein n=1 Tax=Phytophthora ramorum TaxID=164328 RepID=H3H484_PHYRM